MSSEPVRIGPYVLLKSLKKGGMARLYLGFDPADPSRLLAIKTLLPRLVDDPFYEQMFVAEGKLGRRLEHKNIVRTFDSGEADGTQYIAMEYIFGLDLSSVLRRLRKRDRTLPLAHAVAIAVEICNGLSYAHQRVDDQGRSLDIVNRDVSPGNVMIGFDGGVRLVDFGIAQTTIDVRNQIGSIKGKIRYMAPEQVRGMPLDQRADIFSVGSVLYEMMTGVQLFADEGEFATIERVRRAEVTPPSLHNGAIDQTLDQIIAQAMARSPEDRYPSAGALGEALTEWLANQSGPVMEADIHRFMMSLFGRRADEMRQAIDQAHAAARAHREALVGAPVGVPLIPRETLDEIAGLVPDPARSKGVVSTRGRGIWGWIWFIFFAAGIGFVWFFGRR